MSSWSFCTFFSRHMLKSSKREIDPQNSPLHATLFISSTLFATASNSASVIHVALQAERPWRAIREHLARELFLKRFDVTKHRPPPPGFDVEHRQGIHPHIVYHQHKDTNSAALRVPSLYWLHPCRALFSRARWGTKVVRKRDQQLQNFIIKQSFSAKTNTTSRSAGSKLV